jgi:iron complex outermembrane receptor protein
MKKAFLLTAIVSFGYAQEILLKEVELKAKKETFKDSLEVREVRESSARDVGEALTKLEGIWKIRKGGIANDVVLRGFYRDNINVLIDDDRVYGACPNRMDPPAFHVDFSQVERIEVIKGPFDVRHQGSMAGLVNIITKKPEKGFHLKLNASAGSFNFINLSPVVSYADDKLGILVGYSYRYSKPYKDGDGKKITEYANYKPQFMNSKAFEINTYWTKLGFKPIKNHSVEFSYTKQDARHVLYPYLRMDAIYDKTDRFNMNYQIDGISDTLKSLKFHLYYTKVDHLMNSRYRTGMFMQTDAKSKTYGGRLEANLGDLTLGFEAYKRNWDAVTFLQALGFDQSSIPDVDTESFGLYGEYKRNLSDKLRLVAGLRLDTTKTKADSSKANTDLYYDYKNTRSTSKTDTYPSGNVQLFYELQKGTELFVGLGHSVRVPDAQERYFALRRPAMVGSDWVGNPELKPSRNTELDLGIKHSTDKALIKATAFYSFVQDYITVHNQSKVNNVSGTPNSQARSYENVDAQFFGGEVDLRLSLTQELFLFGGMSYVQARKETKPEKNIRSSKVAEIPPLKTRLALRYDKGIYFGEVETILSATQNRVDTDLNEQKTSGYGVVNVKVGGNFKGFTITAGIDNLFDKKYFEHLSYLRDPFATGVKVPEPGRTFYVNASYTF